MVKVTDLWLGPPRILTPGGESFEWYAALQGQYTADPINIYSLHV